MRVTARASRRYQELYGKARRWYTAQQLAGKTQTELEAMIRDKEHR